MTPISIKKKACIVQVYDIADEGSLVPKNLEPRGGLRPLDDIISFDLDRVSWTVHAAWEAQTQYGRRVPRNLESPTGHDICKGQIKSSIR